MMAVLSLTAKHHYSHTSAAAALVPADISRVHGHCAHFTGHEVARAAARAVGIPAAATLGIFGRPSVRPSV